MKRVQLRKDMRLYKEGAEYRILDLHSSEGVVVERVRTGKRAVMTFAQMQEKLLSGDFTTSPPNERKEAVSIEAVSDKAQQEWVRRRAYVHCLAREVKGRSVRAVYADVTEAVAQEIGDRSPPKKSALNSWYRTWVKAGRSDDALIPQWHLRGRKKYAMTDEEEQLCRRYLDQLCLGGQHHNLWTAIEAFLRPDIRQMRADRGVINATAPGAATFYRRWAEIDPYLKRVAFEGRAAADASFDAGGKGYGAESPLEIVYIDHQFMPVHLETAYQPMVIRPWLLAAVDLYSRAPWALALSFHADFASIAAGVRRGILGYSSLLKSMPFVEKSYPVCGMPQLLTTDRGGPFMSDSYKKMSLDLGIDITRTPPQMAHWKGAVESFLGTVKESFISMLPGRIVRVQKKDGGFEDIKETKLTFRQFQQYFFKWVVDIYAHSEHRELENTPMNVWQAGVQQFPPDLPDDPEAVKMACSYWDKRKLQADGINIFNERYQSPELKEIWRRSDATPHDLDIRIDPSDLGQIYVKDKEQHRFIPVPCNSAPMSGVDLWTYQARRGKVNAERKERRVQSDVPMQKRALIEAAGTGLAQTKGQLVRGHARAEMAGEIVRKKPRKVVPPTNSLAPGQTDQGEIERLSKLLQQTIGDQKI